MTLRSISPAAASELIRTRGAVLVDIREPAEHARENIPGARHVPLQALKASGIAACRTPVVFHCQSGNRTNLNAALIEGCAPEEAYLLEGGLVNWRSCGLPTSVDRSRPIEMQRQVQIAAGSLVLVGFMLAAAVSAWFLALPLFVGAGLLFAGISGWCGMAKLLAAMPWNRATA